MTYPFPKTIKEGALLLDKVESGWEHKINTSKLDMHSCCILAQIYGRWGKGMDKLFGYRDCSDDLVFGDNAPVDTWKKEISTRRNTQNKGDFAWACKQLLLGNRVVCTDQRSWIGPENDWLELRDGKLYDSAGSRSDIIFNSIEDISVIYDKIWVLVPKNPRFGELELGDKFRLNGEVYTKVSGSNGEWCGLLGNCCHAIANNEEIEKL